MSRQFELAERLQTWKCEDLNAEIEPHYIHMKCKEIMFWRIYKDDYATGHMHKGTWYIT
jgi:hypothetical protein